ncbi:MAG: hypothetical protein ACLPUG_19515 [Acidimicrobiales bacterium]
MITVHKAGVILLVALLSFGAACSTATSGSSTRATVTTSHAISRYATVPYQGCVGRKRTRLTTAQATRIIDRVRVMAPTQLQETAACPGGPVLIALTPGAELLAHQLLAEYGSNMAITVGLTTYDGSPGRSPRCGTLPPSAPLPAGLHLALRLEHGSVRSGANFFAAVVMSEGGPRSFTIDTGQPLVAVLVRPGTRRVVGVYSGAIAGGGDGLHVKPGRSSTIPVIGGTARCDGGLGSALPPGTYQVIVRVAPEGPHQAPTWLTPPVALRVS